MAISQHLSLPPLSRANFRVDDKHARPKAGDSTSAPRAQAVLEIDTIYAVQSSSGRIPSKWVTAVEKNAQIDVLVRNTDPGACGGTTGYGEAVLGGADLNAG